MITFDKSFYTIWLLISRGWGWGKKRLLLSRRQTRRVTQLLGWSCFIQGRAAAFTLVDTYNNAMEYVRYLPFLSLDPSLHTWPSALCSDNESSDFWLDSISGDPLQKLGEVKRVRSYTDFWFLGFFPLSCLDWAMHLFIILADCVDLSFLTRDWSCTSCIGSTES